MPLDDHGAEMVGDEDRIHIESMSLTDAPMDIEDDDEEEEDGKDPTARASPEAATVLPSSSPKSPLHHVSCNTSTTVAASPTDSPSLDEEVLAQIRELTPEEAEVEWLDAARYDDLDLLRGLFHVHQQHLLDHQDASSGNTALHMAAANGHAPIVAWLLKHGADPHLSNAAGNTPLHWAASNGHEAVVALLVRAPLADVLRRNAFGRSALTEGFTSDNTAVVKVLLEHDSASEERLLSTGGAGTVEMNDDGAGGDDPTEAVDAAAANATTATLVQDLIFSGVELSVREMAMATHETQSIVGQDVPEHDRTGLGIWAASLVAAHWMSHLPLGVNPDAETGSLSSVAPFTVLELGAGCGCPSLVLAKKHPAARVWATDWNPEVVENLRHNVELNSLPNATAWRMDWNDPSTWPPDPQPHVLVGADLIYETSMAELLASVVAKLLPRDEENRARFYYVAPQAPRQGGPAFLAELRRHGLRLASCRHAPPEYQLNPLASGDDDECFMHFHELMSSGFVLYEFAWVQE